MRLKILFFPSALVVAVVLSVWFIRPEFSQFKKDRNELNSQKDILREIKIKKQNVNNLNASLDSNLDKEKLVSDYLPAVEKEEEIISMLNYTATSSGIVLLDFDASVVKDGLKSLKAPKGEEGEADESMVHKTKIKLNLTGSYENIRSFFNQIYGIKRANNISIVNIASQPDSENLLAEAEIYFSYVPLVRLSLKDELSDPIFSRKVFAFEAVDKAAALTSGSSISEIEMNSAGRSNPFLP